MFVSDDQAHSWKRLGSWRTKQCSARAGCADDMTRQFLSVGYDAAGDILYAGSHSMGIARRVGDDQWEWINNGLHPADKDPLAVDEDGTAGVLVPQIEIDQENGDVYILVTGTTVERPHFHNREFTGVYRRQRGASSEAAWEHLRGAVALPGDVASQYELWWYPTSFAIDLSSGGDRETIYVTDFEIGPTYQATGVWRTKDSGATWTRQLSMTHAHHVTIDPARGGRVYATGIRGVSTWGHSGTDWGFGGAFFSDDGGETWFNNDALPLQANAQSVTPDPNDPGMVFYCHFGGGLMHGPAPVPPPSPPPFPPPPPPSPPPPAFRLPRLDLRNVNLLPSGSIMLESTAGEESGFLTFASFDGDVEITVTIAAHTMDPSTGYQAGIALIMSRAGADLKDAPENRDVASVAYKIHSEIDYTWLSFQATAGFDDSGERQWTGAYDSISHRVSQVMLRIRRQGGNVQAWVVAPDDGGLVSWSEQAWKWPSDDSRVSEEGLRVDDGPVRVGLEIRRNWNLWYSVEVSSWSIVTPGGASSFYSPSPSPPPLSPLPPPPPPPPTFSLAELEVQNVDLLPSGSIILESAAGEESGFLSLESFIGDVEVTVTIAAHAMDPSTGYQAGIALIMSRADAALKDAPENRDVASVAYKIHSEIDYTWLSFQATAGFDDNGERQWTGAYDSISYRVSQVMLRIRRQGGNVQAWVVAPDDGGLVSWSEQAWKWPSDDSRVSEEGLRVDDGPVRVGLEIRRNWNLWYSVEVSSWSITIPPPFALPNDSPTAPSPAPSPRPASPTSNASHTPIPDTPPPSSNLSPSPSPSPPPLKLPPPQQPQPQPTIPPPSSSPMPSTSTPLPLSPVPNVPDSTTPFTPRPTPQSSDPPIFTSTPSPPEVTPEAVVAATISLTGITEDEFTEEKQEIFKGGVAMTVGVKRSQVSITSFQEVNPLADAQRRRRLKQDTSSNVSIGLRVDFEILGLKSPEEADTVSEIIKTSGDLPPDAEGSLLKELKGQGLTTINSIIVTATTVVLVHASPSPGTVLGDAHSSIAPSSYTKAVLHDHHFLHIMWKSIIGGPMTAACLAVCNRIR